MRHILNYYGQKNECLPYTDDDILTPYARGLEFWVLAIEHGDKLPSAENIVWGFEGVHLERFVGTLATTCDINLLKSRSLLKAAFDEVTEIRAQAQGISS